MERENVVFLLDVDNTLLDNDRVAQDLRQYLTENFGAERQNRYWQAFEELRSELGYADYLGALQRYRIEFPRDPHILKVSAFLIEYHFANRLYPGSLDAIERMNQWGSTVVLSDGDAVFQPRKVERAGIWDAVEGRVLIYIHKEEMLDDVEQRYPARHYVMVDDKIRILTAMKKTMGAEADDCFRRAGALCERSDGNSEISAGRCESWPALASWRTWSCPRCWARRWRRRKILG